jgi:hypothetical protein
MIVRRRCRTSDLNGSPVGSTAATNDCAACVAERSDEPRSGTPAELDGACGGPPRRMSVSIDTGALASRSRVMSRRNGQGVNIHGRCSACNRGRISGPGERPSGGLNAMRGAVARSRSVKPPPPPRARVDSVSDGSTIGHTVRLSLNRPGLLDGGRPWPSISSRSLHGAGCQGPSRRWWQKRRAAADQAAKSVGGKVEAFLLRLRRLGRLIIADLPDHASARRCRSWPGRRPLQDHRPHDLGGGRPGDEEVRDLHSAGPLTGSPPPLSPT